MNFVLHVWEIMICMPLAHMNKKWSSVSNKNFKTKYLLATTKLPLDRVLVELPFDAKIEDHKLIGWPAVSVQLLSCFCLLLSLNFAQISNRDRVRQILAPHLG